MRRWCFPLLLVSASLALAAERGAVANPRYTGTPFMRTWVAEDYGASPGNQCVLQHPRNGFIYVGNNAGVLEFDGARWRLFRAPNRSVVRALAVDGLGRVWAANDDTICCLVPDAHGEPQAVTMRERLPAEERAFHGAFAMLSAPDGVFVAATGQLFFFGDAGGPARVWKTPGDEGVPLHVWWEDGAPHVEFLNRQVFRVRDAQLERVTILSVMATALGAVRPRGDEGALCATLLADGRVAIGTAIEGLVIRDADGREVQRLDRARGLPSNRIEGLCEDREGGVWLAMRNGLARVQLDSPYALHGAPQHFDGTPSHLELFHGDLYVSSTEGLAHRGADGSFRFLENLLHVSRELVVRDDGLYVTGRDLQVVRTGDRVTVLEPRNYTGMVPLSTAPGTALRSGPTGLWLTKMASDKWTPIARCEKFPGPTTALLEEPRGVVWVVAQAGGVWRIDFTGGARPDAPARNFGPADGLPADLNESNVHAFRFGGGVEFLARGKLLRFDETALRFVPEARITGLRPIGAPKDSSPPLLTEAVVARPDADGGAWVLLPGGAHRIAHIVPDSGAGKSWHANLLPGPPLRRLQVNVLLPDSAAHTLWIGGPGHLVSQDLQWRPARPASAMAVALRRVEAASGVLIWAAGNSAAPSAQLSTLNSSQRALRFVFASPTYAADHTGRLHTQFRTRLDGLDADWSAWSDATSREFTNLPYRDFTFRMQARADDGRTSPAAMLTFSIPPPWWLASWALAAEALIAIALVAAVARHFAARALRRRVQVLEAQAAVEAERLRLARDMHDDLGSGLGRVALLGSQSLKKLDDPAAVESALRKITETAQSLSRATRDIIWAVNPQNDTVPELVAHLAQLAEETLGEAGIRCPTDIAPDLPAVALGAGVRHALLLAMKEAVHNAIKYAEAKTAEFSARLEAGALVVTLRDHGRGFAAGEVRGSGHGVKSIAARLTAHGGRGEVTSEVGQGTTVRLKLPLPAN